MTSIIAIPKSLRDVLGDEGSEALVDIFDKVSEGKKQDVLEFVGEKFERRLTEEVSKINERITEEVSKINEKIMELRVELKESIITMIKWQVGMFITTVALLLGLYATIIFK